MSDWAVLGLDGDPCPGDPGRTRELAGRLRGAAELAEHNTARLRQVAAGGGDLRMEGDYAPKFRDVLSGLPDELAKLGRAYRGAGEAVAGFATSLEQVKSQAGSALRAGRDADAASQGAVRQLQAVLPADRAAGVVAGRRVDESPLETAIADLDEGDVPRRYPAGFTNTQPQNHEISTNSARPVPLTRHRDRPAAHPCRAPSLCHRRFRSPTDVPQAIFVSFLADHNDPGLGEEPYQGCRSMSARMTGRRR